MAQTQRMSARVSQALDQMRPELDSAPRVSIWEEPNVIAGVEGNRRLKYSLLAGVVLLLLSLSLITYLESKNRFVMAVEDGADNLGLRLIGTIPLLPRWVIGRDASRSRPNPMWQSMLTESVDAARTML